jgi:hypothetical protein
VALTEELLVADSGDDDWFGDGSVFNTQAELAAALRAPYQLPLRAPRAHIAPVPEPVQADAPADEGEQETPDDTHHGLFEVVDPRLKETPTFDADLGLPLPAPRKPASPAPRPSIPTWSVRVPGVQLLPPRQPGRSGWSLCNSLRILQQADELVVRLREEAVVAAFSAAARALRNDAV